MSSFWHLYTLVASHCQEILSVLERIISLTQFPILTLMLEVSSSTSSNTICPPYQSWKNTLIVIIFVPFAHSLDI